MGSSPLHDAASVPSDILHAINRFDQEATEIVGSLLTRLEQTPEPQIIYHYTTDLGLRGILTSGKLWLTDIFSLNDPSELKHGYSLAVSALEERVSLEPREVKVFADGFKSALDWGIKKSAYYFACCLSHEGDELGQWRAYAGDGRGYALGFEATSLEKEFLQAAKTRVSGGEGFSVNYNESILIDIHRNIVEKIIPLTQISRGRNLSHQAFIEYWRELLKVFSVHVLHASLYFKHRAYLNEREYRFLELHVGNKLPDVKFRAREYELIKYREFDWKSANKGILKKIVIGPAADCDKARAFVDQCLRDCNLIGVDVIPSDIPYRACNSYHR